MNVEHPKPFLGAYLDGELSASQVKMVQDHLEHCAACREEVEELKRLSHLLSLSAQPDVVTPADRFAAQVGLQLSRQPLRSVRRPSYKWGWWLIPAGIIAAWVMIQAAAIVINLTGWLGWLGIGGQAVAWLSSPLPQPDWLASTLSLYRSNIPVDPSVIKTLATGEWLGWSMVINFVVLAALGGIYWAWLVLFWQRIDRKVLADMVHEGV